MGSKYVIEERIGAVARITIDRPECRNALSRKVLEDLDSAFRGASMDSSVRVIILAGAGEDFSSGHDLGTPDEVRDFMERPYPGGYYWFVYDWYYQASLRWRDISQPTIAQVQGRCWFGAWQIASPMDLIVASPDATFMGTHFQYFFPPWDMGFRKAKEILFQPQRIMEIDEAVQAGFINQVVPRDRLEETTLELASRIAESDPEYVQAIKRSVNATQNAMGFQGALETSFKNFWDMYRPAYEAAQQDGNPEHVVRRMNLKGIKNNTR